MFPVKTRLGARTPTVCFSRTRSVRTQNSSTSPFITRAVRHQFEVSTPFLYFVPMGKMPMDKIKEIKKEDSRLSEIGIIQQIFSRLFTIVILESDPCFYTCFHRLSYRILHF